MACCLLVTRTPARPPPSTGRVPAFGLLAEPEGSDADHHMHQHSIVTCVLIGVHCSGTAMESSWTARLKVLVHKKADPKVPALYKDLPTPLLENANEWCWHGYTFNDYLHDPLLQVGLGRVGAGPHVHMCACMHA